MAVIFTSERLLFREFTTRDVELVRELNSDPEVTRYVHDSTISWEPVEIIKKVIVPQYRLYNHGRWAVHLKDNMEFIGWCGLKRRPEYNYVDLGYRFMKRYWGHGYATEAATACLRYGIGVLKLTRIFAMAHLENSASWKVLEKSGMQYIGDSQVDNMPVRTYEILAPNS